MKKSIQILCKQNPTINVSCAHCKKSHTLKTIEFFKEDSYPLICSDCGETTNCDTKKFVKDFEKQLKFLGVKW